MVDTPLRVFVSGTDTGVGKTVVAAMLAQAWGAHYWKPVQAGTEEPTDAETVARIAAIPAERILPERYRLAAPRSPDQAAALEGVAIELGDFEPPQASGALVVEGAGGVLVPLNSRHLMIDLIERLALPVVVAARSGLGTINHTLLTLHALAARDLAVAGVVMIGPEHPENRAAIERWGRVPVIGALPWLPALTPESLRAAYAAAFVPPDQWGPVLHE